MNHLETLTAEWLAYNGYFVHTAVKVGKRAKGGWDGELDVVAVHPARRHFLHVECSIAATTWENLEKTFKRKFTLGRKHARDLFSGMELPTALDQAVVYGYAAAADQHRELGGGRLVTGQELTAEIITGIPAHRQHAVPEKYPLLRTLQFAKMAGAKVNTPNARLIPREVET
ncbi:MAG: hypothetical protein IH851_13815 [Armatimonadetes bacterium]|nr:hypothetical protein [Armatimonadota bacterium]